MPEYSVRTIKGTNTDKMAFNNNFKSGQMIKKTAIEIAVSIIVMGSWSTGGAQEADVPLHYNPEGMYIWDTWYLQKCDTTHMFHLQVKRAGSNRPDRDEGSIGHAVSTDLIHWKELPVALHSGSKDVERPYDDETLFTGSAIEHNGVIYNFYCGNTTVHFGENNPFWRQSMCLATSTDGI